MKRRALLAAAITSSVCAAPAKRPNDLDPNLHARIHYCYINGLRYAFGVRRSVCEKLPKWTPFDGTPVPLLPKIAYDLAKAHLDTIKIPDDHGWELEHISLDPLGGMGPDDRWMYVVDFWYFYRGGSSGPQTHMKYMITLDGKFVEPIVQKYPD